MALKPNNVATATPERAIARQRNSAFDADGAQSNAGLLWAPGRVLLTAAALKEQAMFRKPYSLSKQLVVATALALGASGVALADDSSMNPFTGDSYKYFNGGHTLGDPGQFNRPVASNVPADPSWRQSHPNGLPERELQALSSSGLSASAAQLDPPVLARAAADPTWRQSHPNGLTERELQALSSSTLAVWQPANASMNTMSTDQVNVAQPQGSDAFSVRLARFFHTETTTQARTYQ
jgi:hypothetical protein